MRIGAVGVVIAAGDDLGAAGAGKPRHSLIYRSRWYLRCRASPVAARRAAALL